MKSKEYFRKINYLKTAIEFKLEKAEFYKELAQSAGGTVYSDMPKPPKGSVRSPMEEAMIKALDLEIEAKKDEEELSRLTVEALNFIERIEDLKLQKILILRYLKELNWYKIQRTMDYSESAIHKLHNKALAKMDVIINEKYKK
ncbi:hypothetical protein [Ligilactobacillus ceti]|uniref:RNA polymerase sigma-70 region 4 domain-containing protein n=1 Tax=Ligilactobacillus ceti DSM 22408 TaxID=1122146 RepID=A0A0R2KR94_9LACO|nr:hypothetical protein [Ligilactobacillus ceti]KRN88717.1 hypothetical protein IV53_GL000684 [Ligilactobacillus ceti DSM 22408]